MLSHYIYVKLKAFVLSLILGKHLLTFSIACLSMSRARDLFLCKGDNPTPTPKLEYFMSLIEENVMYNF